MRADHGPDRTGRRSSCVRRGLRAGAFVAALTAAPAQAQDVAAVLAEFDWLAGVWQTTIGPQTVEERWTEPASNSLLGMGRTLADGRMIAFEYLRIEARANGVFYVAQPNGAAQTDFRLTSWNGVTAIFENPLHDFPKRISYTRRGDDAIDIRVDGGADVEAGALEFRYQRRGGG